MNPTSIIRRIAVAGSVLLLATGAAVAPATAASTPVPSPTDTTKVIFYTPVGTATDPGVADTSKVHVLLGAGVSVAAVKLGYRAHDASGSSATWTDIGGVLTRDSGTGLFETTLTTLPEGEIDLQATGYSDTTATTPVTGTPAVEEIVLDSTSTGFTLNQPTSAGKQVRVGVYRRADGHSYAAISGTTTGTTAPTLDDPAHDPLAASAYSVPTGVLNGKTFTAAVDLGGYGTLSATSQVVVRAQDSLSSDAEVIAVYDQVVTSVRATATAVPGTNTQEITATVYDQYGQPVTGVLMHLGGQAAGPVARQYQAVVSDVRGQATFSSAGVTSPGGYDAYADLNLNTFHTTGEPGYQVILGEVSYAAPGHSLYHNNKQTKNGSGTVGDSRKGTLAAAAKQYDWIDQNGHLAFANAKRKRAGASAVTKAGQLVWVNAHGSPYNPKWLKKGRFETTTWTALKKRKGLRNAQKTLQQNARNNVSVEWEVKDIKPFTSTAALNAAFANLASNAQAAYGAAWRDRVQVKVLSNLSGGQKFALQVLQAAHAQGFTTIFLARGATTRTQTIPAAAQAYVDYVRGANAAIYPSIPSSSQSAAIVVKTPPLV